MRCFEVGEHLKFGLRIVRFPEPHVLMRSAVPLYLDPKLCDFIQHIPPELEGDLTLQSANIMMMKGPSVRLAAEPPEWKDTKALVHVTTQTAHGRGVRGTISLSANSYTEHLDRGSVVKRWHPFPSAGVRVLLGSPAVHQDQDGAWLELFVVMEAGASFRIVRTGDLQGAAPEISVQWANGCLDTKAISGARRRRRRSRRKRPAAKAAALRA